MSQIYMQQLASQNLGKLAPGGFSNYTHPFPEKANTPEALKLTNATSQLTYSNAAAPSATSIITSQPLPISNSNQKNNPKARTNSVVYPGANFRNAKDKEPTPRSQMPIQIQHDYINTPGNERTKYAFHTFGPRTVNILVGAPPGLEYLATLDRLFVKQKINLLGIFTGCEMQNEYRIYDGVGHEIFNATENSRCATRLCCGAFRPFEMSIKDSYGQEVIQLARPLSCGIPCFPCCLQSIQVFAPRGSLIGKVEQVWSGGCNPVYFVKNSEGDPVMKIQGPPLTCSCCCRDVEFVIRSVESGEEVGKIAKKWSGFAKELFSDADNFGITFPLELDVKMKATMLGACMLIDYMFFETPRN